MRQFVPGPAKVPVRYARSLLAQSALRPLTARANSLDAALDLAFSFESHHVRITPYQLRSEIRALLELLAADPPRVVLEIGTAKGGTLFLLTRVAAPDALLVTVDLPGGPFGGGYDRSRRMLLRGLARERQQIVPIRADSSSTRTATRVRRLLGSRPVDFLLVDGDHRAAGLRRDLELYRPFVRGGGLIALHDVAPGPADSVGDVPAVWRELREQADPAAVIEIVESWEQGGAGFGVLRV